MRRARRAARRGVILAALLASPAPLFAQSVTPPVVTTLPATTPVPAGSAEPPRDTGIKPARHRHAPGDPAEGVNRALFSIHQVLDRYLFRPVALAYKTVIPKIVRRGIRHVISNLTEPVVFVNDVLQLKPKRAVRTFTRFAVNSSLGIGGVLDVAKAGALPHRANGFGNTLARYGVGPGPYLFLPLVGPTDLRDLIGGQADGLVLPVAVGYPFDSREYIIPRAVLGGLDARAEADADLKILLGGAADPYATLRSVYLQNRAAEIRAIRLGEGAAPRDTIVDPGASPGTTSSDAFDSTPIDPEEPGTSATPAQPDAFDSTPDDPEPEIVPDRPAQPNLPEQTPVPADPESPHT